MIYQTINYSDDGRVNMQTYIPEITKGPLLPAMIALPGGAWTHLEKSEGEMVALTFVREGYAGFVLNYSVGDYSEFPNPLEEICWAIYTIRQNAKKWHMTLTRLPLPDSAPGHRWQACRPPSGSRRKWRRSLILSMKCSSPMPQSWDTDSTIWQPYSRAMTRTWSVQNPAGFQLSAHPSWMLSITSLKRQHRYSSITAATTNTFQSRTLGCSQPSWRRKAWISRCIYSRAAIMECR